MDDYQLLLIEVRDMIQSAIPDRIMFRYRNKSPIFLAKKFGFRPTKGQLPYVLAKFLIIAGALTPEQGLAFCARSPDAIAFDLNNILTNDAALAALHIKLGGVSVSGSSSEQGVQTEKGPVTEPEVIKVHYSGAKRTRDDFEAPPPPKNIIDIDDEFDDLPDLVNPPEDIESTMWDVD